ncbi:MAG TPA: hypothetical protein VET87_17950 [Rubrivivax sp.]|nr:hypothetical protein [Rubrivivax sp.]
MIAPGDEHASAVTPSPHNAGLLDGIAVERPELAGIAGDVELARAEAFSRRRSTLAALQRIYGLYPWSRGRGGCLFLVSTLRQFERCACAALLIK